MGYVINNLDEEKDKQANGIGSAPSTPAPKQQGVASVVAPQQTAQQQHGTGFTNLSEWLNAGTGRDKAISDVGAQKLGNEQSAFGKAKDTAETSLNGQHVINLQGDVGTALDRSAGVNTLATPRAGNAATTAATPAPAPSYTPAQQPTTLAGVMKGGRSGSGLSLTRAAPVAPTAMPGNFISQPGTLNTGPIASPEVRTGPTLEDVLNQKYSGATGIDYKAGDDFQAAKMLGNTGTVADVLGKNAIGQGQYSQGMRALDNVLYGADGASQNAIKGNADNTAAFQKDATAKAGDFATRAQGRADAMSDAAGKTRDALTKIGDDTKASLDQRAAAANAKAQADSTSTTQVFNPQTGKMENVAPGQVIGGWEGAAPGSANAGNVMSDAEDKRFGALKRLLGYSAPTKNGSYQEGRLTTKADPSQVPELSQNFTDEQLQAARQWVTDAQSRNAQTRGVAAALPFMDPISAIIGGVSRIGEEAKSHAGVRENYSDDEWKQILAAVKKRYGISPDDAPQR